MKSRLSEKTINRREFLRKGTLAAAVIPAAGAAIAMLGCTRNEESDTAQIGETDAGQNARESSSAGSAGAGELKHVTDYPNNASVLKALSYVEKSPHKEQRCDNCQFYTAGAGSQGMGKCQLIPLGAVKAEAWCSSWQPRAN